MSLLETQRAIRRALCADGPSDAVAGLPAAAVSIHRNNMLHALTRALALGFPAVERMVGANFFQAMAAAFVRRSPPSSVWLDIHGEDFAAFIKTFAPARPLPYLADLARLDRAAALAAMADPRPAVCAADLAGLDADGATALHFRPHSSLRLLTSPFPVDALRRAALTADEAALQQLDLDEPVRLLVRGTREPSEAPQILRLNDAGFRFTRLLVEGACLGEALRQVPEEADGRALALHLSGPSFRSASAAPLPFQELC
jgi:hypothetical protein